MIVKTETWPETFGFFINQNVAAEDEFFMMKTSRVMFPFVSRLCFFILKDSHLITNDIL